MGTVKKHPVHDAHYGGGGGNGDGNGDGDGDCDGDGDGDDDVGNDYDDDKNLGAIGPVHSPRQLLEI